MATVRVWEDLVKHHYIQVLSLLIASVVAVVEDIITQFVNLAVIYEK